MVTTFVMVVRQFAGDPIWFGIVGEHHEETEFLTMLGGMKDSMRRINPPHRCDYGWFKIVGDNPTPIQWVDTWDGDRWVGYAAPIPTACQPR